MVVKVTTLIVTYYSSEIQFVFLMKAADLLLIEMFGNLLTEGSKMRKTKCCTHEISKVLGS